MKYNLGTLSRSQAQVDGLMADFSGLKNLEKAVDKVLERLQANPATQTNYSMAKSGAMSKEQFDGWFSELIRKELGKVLAIMRARAIEKARTQGRAGSASTAILRRTYKNEFTEALTIGGNRGRISSRKRVYMPGTKKPRHVSDRTRDLNEYFGPDRSFILRFLEFGTDVRTAKTFGPTGRRSTASYGARGAIAPRSFFHTMSSDMEQAAQQLGQTLTGYVEDWLEKEFKDE